MDNMHRYRRSARLIKLNTPFKVFIMFESELTLIKTCNIRTSPSLSLIRFRRKAERGRKNMRIFLALLLALLITDTIPGKPR